MRRHTIALAGLLGLLLTSEARATDYNDVTTDFSNAFGSPTTLSLTVGSNVLTGRTGLQSSVIDRDYFRINVPAGHHLTSLTLVSTDTPSQTFFGLESGMVFSDPATTTQGMMLGWMHFRNNATFVGQNLEPLLAAGSGALGFSPPLGPGDYSFWLQENGTPVVNYQLNFVLAADPPPFGAPALPALFAAALTLGLGGLGARRMGAGRRATPQVP